MGSLEHIIQVFGYPAIALGTFLEGETVLMLGAFAAHRGYLELPLVILSAFAGSFSGDLLYFVLGRTRGKRQRRRSESWKRRLQRANRILAHHRILAMFGSRFLYGLRTIIPFAIGLSEIPTRQFVLLSILSNVLWATLFGVLGFVFGHALSTVVHDLHRYELAILVGAAVIGTLVWVVNLVRRRS